MGAQADRGRELQSGRRQQLGLSWALRQPDTLTLRHRGSRWRCGAADAPPLPAPAARPWWQPHTLTLRLRCSRWRCTPPLRAQAAPATAAQPGLAAEAAPLDGKLKIIGAQQQDALKAHAPPAVLPCGEVGL